MLVGEKYYVMLHPSVMCADLMSLSVLPCVQLCGSFDTEDQAQAAAKKLREAYPPFKDRVIGVAKVEVRSITTA